VAEPRSRLRRRRLGFGVALVFALLGVAFLVWSVTQHQEASDDLADARAQLATRRANTSNDVQQLQHTLDAVGTVHEQLAALGPGVTELAELDQQDLDSLRAAIQAGLVGNVADYNAAGDQRAALDPQHDALLEQLRQQANAVITTLDPLR
jgi:hypothetical protein